MHLVNVMTQVIQTMKMCARAEKVAERMAAAWDWWEDGATDAEVSEILSGFVAAAVAFRDDANRDPVLRALPSLKALTPAIAATQLAGEFDDFLWKCDALGGAMAMVQRELGV